MRFSLATISAVLVASAVAAPAPEPETDYKAVANTFRLVMKRANIGNSNEKRACDWDGYSDCAEICNGMCPIGAPPGCGLGVGVCLASCADIYDC